MNSIKARLEYLRTQIQAENISYSEIAELQLLAKYIEPGDIELLEWAGVREGARVKMSEKDKTVATLLHKQLLTIRELSDREYLEWEKAQETTSNAIL